MNGSTWASLIQLYVKSINSGQVPDIESSWTYICRSKAQQGLMNAMEYLQKEFESIVMPLSIIDLERLLSDTEKTATKDMKRQLLGDPEVVTECISQFEQIFK